jgi:putative endopeptidase
VQKILVLTGTPANKAAAEAQQVIDLETRIAQLSRPLVDLRNPRANYAPIAVDTLAKTYRNLQLAEFLKAQGVTDDTVSIANPQLFTQLDQLAKSLKPAQWKTYLRWRVGDAMAPYMAKPWRDASFDFRGRVLAGQAAPPSRQQVVLDAINLARARVRKRSRSTCARRSRTRSPRMRGLARRRSPKRKQNSLH